MGLVIPFPASPRPYPTFVAALDAAERVLLAAMRQWVSAFREAEDPLPRLCDDLAAAGIEEAACPVDALMGVVARSARRTVAIHCPRCRALADDEQHLLRAVSLTQAGDADLAERVLRTALLTAQGAEIALGPIEELSHVFAAAGLFLRRRQQSPDDQDAVESWTPPASEEFWR
jgi:hypothetical protein